MVPSQPLGSSCCPSLDLITRVQRDKLLLMAVYTKSLHHNLCPNFLFACGALRAKHSHYLTSKNAPPPPAFSFGRMTLSHPSLQRIQLTEHLAPPARCTGISPKPTLDAKLILYPLCLGSPLWQESHKSLPHICQYPLRRIEPHSLAHAPL